MSVIREWTVMVTLPGDCGKLRCYSFVLVSGDTVIADCTGGFFCTTISHCTHDVLSYLFLEVLAIILWGLDRSSSAMIASPP